MLPLFASKTSNPAAPAAGVSGGTSSPGGSTQRPGEGTQSSGAVASVSFASTASLTSCVPFELTAVILASIGGGPFAGAFSPYGQNEGGDEINVGHEGAEDVGIKGSSTGEAPTGFGVKMASVVSPRNFLLDFLLGHVPACTTAAATSLAALPSLRRALIASIDTRSPEDFLKCGATTVAAPGLSMPIDDSGSLPATLSGPSAAHSQDCFRPNSQVAPCASSLQRFAVWIGDLLGRHRASLVATAAAESGRERARLSHETIGSLFSVAQMTRLLLALRPAAVVGADPIAHRGCIDTPAEGTSSLRVGLEVLLSVSTSKDGTGAEALKQFDRAGAVGVEALAGAFDKMSFLAFDENLGQACSGMLCRPYFARQRCV